jgi:CPA2 family monovalent cation:H+ antiporter-2
MFGFATSVAIMAGAGLFQIGEFSFILAQGGLNGGIITDQIYSLIVSSAIVTMLLTPVSMAVNSRFLSLWLKPVKEPGKIAHLAGKNKLPSDKNLAVIAGFGRIGQNVAQSLKKAGIMFIVIEIDPEIIHDLRCDRMDCLYGDASNSLVLERVDLLSAKLLIVTFPEPRAVVTTVKCALEINPELKIIARVQRARDAEVLT